MLAWCLLQTENAAMKAELIALRRDTAAIGSAAGVAVEPVSAMLTGANGPLVRPCLACYQRVPIAQRGPECCFGGVLNTIGNTRENKFTWLQGCQRSKSLLHLK